MTAIETACRFNWKDIWVKTDSQLVVLALKDAKMVPWSIRNKWTNCLEAISKMIFFASHIRGEGNTCADGLANIGLALSSHV